MGFKANETRLVSRLRTFYYWTLLVLTLVVFDDLVVGPLYWALSQLNVLLSMGMAFAVAWYVGYRLLRYGLHPHDGANKFIKSTFKRLNLERKNPELQKRETQLTQKVVSSVSAIGATLLIGGTLTTLLLRRKGIVDDDQAKHWGFWLCGLYAIEFMLLHAFAGGTALSSVIGLF